MAPKKTHRKPFLTLAKTLRHEIEPIKNSRFITEVRPISSEDEALTLVDSLRQEMADACHHCWAFQLRDPHKMRSSDDGEPGGSAGRPILAVLQGRELFNVVAVVVRYFGGTKLGVGGLMRAYGGATAKTLDRGDLLTITPKRPLWLEYSYEDTNPIQQALSSLNLVPTENEYTGQVRSLIEIPDDQWEAVRDALIDQSAGRVQFKDPT
jgi:uncharacterized YigZ family protein